eukprot:PITA_13321
MSGYATTQKILRVGYFWLLLFKDCITAVQKCHNCQMFDRKMRAPPAPLHPIIAIGPFTKWGIDFITSTFEEEKRLLYLAQLDENRRNVALAVETHAKRIKAQYDRNATPHNFLEGDLVLLYDQEHDKLGAGKFVPMWHGPYIVKRKLAKGAYELEDFDGVSLGKPRNGLYLKRYYA